MQEDLELIKLANTRTLEAIPATLERPEKTVLKRDVKLGLSFRLRKEPTYAYQNN
jgi:hypothetical protein